MATLVACVGSKSVTIAASRMGRLRQLTSLPANEEGRRAFRALLQAWHGAAIRLTVETPDEDYRVELLPHARGGQRRELLERRLQQFYRDSRLRAARVLQVVKGKRSEDRCLFAALTDDRILAPWLEALNDAGIPVAGVFPAPLLLSDALERLRCPFADVLVITQWNEAVRQTFLQSTCPRMTRVITLPRQDGDVAALLHEIRQTRVYLEGLGLLPAGAMLHVLVLDADDRFRTIEQVPKAASMPVTRLAPQALARALSVRPRSFDANVLRLQLLARHAGSMNLASREMLLPYIRRRVARGLILATVLVAAASGVTGGLYARDALSAAATRRALDAQLEHGKRHRVREPAAPLSDHVLSTVAAAENMRASDASRAVYRVISGALDGQGQLVLLSLRWQAERAGPSSEPGTGPSGQSGRERSGETGAVGSLVTIARLRILAPAQDLRRASETMQAFVAALGRQPSVRSAAISARPSGLGAEDTLRGGVNSTAAEPAALEFEVSVRLSPDAAPA